MLTTDPYADLVTHYEIGLTALLSVEQTEEVEATVTHVRTMLDAARSLGRLVDRA